MKQNTQAHLMATSNIIVQYLDVVGSGSNYDNGASATVGIENADGSDGLGVSYNCYGLNCTANSIQDGMVIKFVAPSSPSAPDLFFSEYGEGST